MTSVVCLVSYYDSESRTGGDGLMIIEAQTVESMGREHGRQ